MASQGERELGVVDMDEGVLESMAQDGDPEQEMLVVEEHEPPQMDPEPEMGGAAAASDTPPPHLRQSPSPLPSEASTDRGNPASSGSFDMNQLGEMLMGMRKQMDTNTNKLREEMKEMRGEMQQMGHGLQAGIMAFASDEMWTAGGKKWRRHVLGRTS